MSTGATSAALSFAFADLGVGLWGVSWSSAGAQTKLILGEGNGVRTVDAEIDADSAQGEWRVSGDGVELALEPIGPAVDGGDEAPTGDLDQLFSARGRLGRESSDVAVDCLGWRQVRTTLVGLDWSTIRQAAAWFGPEEGITLTALRPPAAADHDRDVVEAAMLGSEHAGPVEDPRLSTTYAADGRPKGAGVELWLAREDSDELYPLRASGQAVGPQATWSQQGVELLALLFRWYSRGHDGAGIYLLGRRT